MEVTFNIIKDEDELSINIVCQFEGFVNRVCISDFGDITTDEWASFRDGELNILQFDVVNGDVTLGRVNSKGYAKICNHGGDACGDMTIEFPEHHLAEIAQECIDALPDD